MRTLVALTVLLASPSAIPAPSYGDRAFVRKFERHFRLAKSIKVGMTKGQFDRLYMPDGGLQTVPASRFVYRALPYFKVEVEFVSINGARRSNEVARPQDRIGRLGPIVLDGPAIR